jgi:hypothetical protein
VTAIDDRPVVHGPYQSHDAAFAEARHVYQAAAANRGLAVMPRILEGIELATLRTAGVELGDYDRQIAGWLSSWEPEVVEVILGWVERAHAAGKADLFFPIRAMLAEPGDGPEIRSIKCLAHGCAQTALLRVGSDYLCPDHGGDG